VALEQHAERVRIGAGEPPKLKIAAGVHTDKCPVTRLRFPAVIPCHQHHRRLGQCAACESPSATSSDTSSLAAAPHGSALPLSDKSGHGGFVLQRHPRRASRRKRGRRRRPLRGGDTYAIRQSCTPGQRVVIAERKADRPN
jgi:hypothetical protein